MPFRGKDEKSHRGQHRGGAQVEDRGGELDPVDAVGLQGVRRGRRQPGHAHEQDGDLDREDLVEKEVLVQVEEQGSDPALAALLADGGLRPGRTEREVGRDLEALMVTAGATGPSFETIVAAGANSAVGCARSLR